MSSKKRQPILKGSNTHKATKATNWEASLNSPSPTIVASLKDLGSEYGWFNVFHDFFFLGGGPSPNLFGDVLLA